jgi:hypothetical protein
MEIIHFYKIESLEQVNDNSGTVCSVSYKVTSTDKEDFVDSHERLELNTKNIQNFISYEELTKETVMEWIKKDQKSIEIEKFHVDLLNHRKYSQKPETITTELPWS